MAWKIEVDGKTFRTDDLTLDEALLVEEATGLTWTALNPLRSAKDCRAVVRAFLLRSHGEAEAEAILKKLKASAIVESINVADDDLPDSYADGLPNPEGAPSTPTS